MLKNAEHKRKRTKKKRSTYGFYSILIFERIELYNMENNNQEIECRPTETTADLQTEPMQEIATLDPFCEGKCGVCDSGFAAEINAQRPHKTLRELSEYLKSEYGLELSKDILHTHFKKYGLKLRSESLKKAYEIFEQDAQSVALHTKQTLFLAQATFQEILNRMSNGTMKVELQDYERLLKLYYQILQSPETAPQAGLVETFILAQRKYGVPLTQSSFSFPQAEPQEQNVT